MNRWPPRWWDGLWASFYGVWLMGVLVGIAIGKVVWG